MQGQRKLQMLKHTQHLAFAMTLVYILAYLFEHSMPIQVLVYGLGGIGANFAAFVVGNVKGDHKNDAAPSAPAAQ